jgi:hypothetical protein
MFMVTWKDCVGSSVPALASLHVIAAVRGTTSLGQQQHHLLVTGSAVWQVAAYIAGCHESFVATKTHHNPAVQMLRCLLGLLVLCETCCIASSPIIPTGGVCCLLVCAETQPGEEREEREEGKEAEA